MREVAALGLIGGLASIATAGPILSFGYTDLAGSYNSASGEFAAVASAAAETATAGDVTRLAAPGGTANFDAGFFGTSLFADAQFMLTVTFLDPNSAVGIGSFILTDDDGDTISGDIDGAFLNLGNGQIAFQGLLGNVFLSGSEFNGTDGGAFDMDLPGNAPYEGALVQLFIASSGGFFDASFDGVSVQADGQLVPTPASIALLAAGGLAISRRRKS